MVKQIPFGNGNQKGKDSKTVTPYSATLNAA
jgi:hypothetical protein